MARSYGFAQALRAGFQVTPLFALAVIVFFLTAGRTAAETKSVIDSKIDRYVDREMKARRVPGLSLAVLKDGKILKASGYGFANVELNAPATPATVFQLASITKSFTATAVMRLVEDKKIGLHDPVTTLLPQLPKQWSQVTIWHLLTHTSGIKNYTQSAEIGDNPGKEMAAREIIGLVENVPLQFSPGEKYDYSNTGYYVLGMLIEKVSGQSYDGYLQKIIFEPLKMNDTRMNSFAEIIPRRATGYVLTEKGIANGIFVSPTQPFAAGALVTTVLDLAKWDAALYSEKILKQAALEQMWTPASLRDGNSSSYGLGWGTWIRKGRRYTQHNGGIIGFSSHIRRDLDAHFTVIVLANLSGKGIIAEEIAEGISEIYETTEPQFFEARLKK